MSEMAITEKASSTSVEEPFRLPVDAGNGTLKVSFIVEWANTTYNGVHRFFGFLDIFKSQWQELVSEEFPDNLGPQERNFLRRISPNPEFLIIAGEGIDSSDREKIQQTCGTVLQPSIHVSAGLEYYALKNFGADLATGDIICFLDSDLYPDKGWLAHLVGTFANPNVLAAAGQPYVGPIDLFSRAFALGWTYDLPDPEGRVYSTDKFYANNVAFVTKLYRRYPFPPLQRRTRGSAALLGMQLYKEGHHVWQNDKALVDHPAPSGWRHLAVRALAHGRDIYMKLTEERSMQGLVRSQKTAGYRLCRGFRRIARYWRDVGLKRHEIVPAMLIITSYYGLFSLGGLLTHISPQWMGRRFRL